MSDQVATTQELSPELIEAAKKLLKQKVKKEQKAKENVRVNYPWADAETIRLDVVANKMQVDVTCTLCGDVHPRYTSDLFQTNGVCSKCKKQATKAAKEERKALLKRVTEMLASGQLKDEDLEEGE
ncbi:MAG: hypothetical protein Q8P59_11975 [Dehalococcoidia bacterium]|nr:hypothetical protein [Dehalococcoidia bacterium]